MFSMTVTMRQAFRKIFEQYCTRLHKRLSMWMKSLSAAIQKKAIEQFFHVVLFIMLYKVVLTLRSVNETLVCDHSNESY